MLNVDQLQSLHHLELDRLARCCAGCLVHCRLLLGRCLLALKRTDIHERLGYSCPVHYAKARLGLDAQEARDVLRVARRLEDLPLLTAAAEEGSIDWCALREVTRQATPENEAYWLHMARTCSMRRLERLLRQQRDDGSTRSAERVELKMILPAEVMAMFQRAIRQLSYEAGRPVSAAQAMECLCAEKLAGQSFPEEAVAERLQEEARRDLAAEEEDSWEAPWAAVAAHEAPCPGAEELQLVSAARPSWENPLLRFNPEARHLTPAQRAEILRRDGYRCSTPGCPHTLWLHVHHVVYYAQGGVTAPTNCLIVCSACHRNIHQGNLRVDRGDSGLLWHSRQGWRIDQRPRCDPGDWLDRWLEAG